MTLAWQVVGGLALASEASAVKLLTQDMLQVGCARVETCTEGRTSRLCADHRHLRGSFRIGRWHIGSMSSKSIAYKHEAM